MSQQDATAQLSFELYDAARLLRRDFDRRARAHGLSRSRWQVLWHLARIEGAKQAELAEVLDVAPISLARQLDNLEQEGLIERRRDPRDRRCFRLHLTDAARPALKTLRELAAETRHKALAGFDNDAVLRLQHELRRVRENLGQDEQKDTD